VSDLPECEAPPPALLVQGIREFNRREFYECHETLETLWMAESGPIRELYQGIIQVGVGFYHVGRGNHIGAVRTMRRGVDRLHTLPSRCHGVDVGRLIADAETALHRVVELGPARIADFDNELIPTIDLGVPG